MSEHFDEAVLIAVPAGLTGMCGIALFRTRRCRHLVRVGMPRFVHERVRILIAAGRTEVRYIPLVRTGRGHENFLKGMPVCRNEIVRIAVAAVGAGIDCIALLRTGSSYELRGFIIVLTTIVHRRIRYRRSARRR